MVSRGKMCVPVQSSISQDNVPDPTELDLEPGQNEPELCFSRSQTRDLAHALLDRAPPMYYFQGTCYLEEHVHLRSLSILLWAKRRLDVGEMKSLQKTEHIQFFFGPNCKSSGHEVLMGEW